MFKLFDAVTLGMRVLLLDAVVVSEEIVTIRLDVTQLRGIHIIDVLAD